MFLNREYLNRVARSSSMDSQYRQNQVLNENRTIFSSNNTYDIFLSHSYLDHNSVYAIVDLFNKSGYSVYVDWMVDTQLDRSQVNRTTAETLRHRMGTCRGLAYVSSANSTNSKWCPWELGYVDGRKNGRCAILPVLDTASSTFTGQEYLSLYPYIDYAEYQSSSKMEFWVNDPQDCSKYVSLKDWLNGKNPYKHI